MQWSHKILGVCRVFWCIYSIFKNAPNNAYNLTRAIFRVWEIQK
jgi:hypothetical protein